MFKRSVLTNVILVAALVLSLAPALALAAPGLAPAAQSTSTSRADTLVLVNSASPYYADFQHYIQPYLGNFGVPYTELNIAAVEVEADIGDYALIIVGHRQLDPDDTYLDATEEGHISAAVSAGTGLVNFDNDLSVGGSTPRYQFVQDIFGFDYVPPGTGAGVAFTSVEGGGSLQINCWEDDHQDPVLSTTTTVGDLIPDDNLWTEFLWASRGYPGVFAGYDESPPLMRFYGAVPDGEYELVAHLYWSHNLRYFWGYSADAPQAYSIDVTSGNSGDFADYTLGTVTVTGGQFEIYVQNADPLAGGVDYPFWGWAWIRLVPVGAPPPEMHYITARHQAGESISTGSMTMAGITLPEGVTALAMTGSQPFLAVTASGLGHAVQWGSYNWMSHSVKGPIYGLDDLVWRSIVWAARKPFVMQGLPNFVTMRVDDESGPFGWIEIANEFGIKPWAGLFYYNVDATEAAQLSALVNSGNATAAVHAKTGAFFYYNHGVGDFPDEEIAANYVHATAWHADRDIPISKFVLPHYYEFGTNVFQGLSDWGVEFVGTMMAPGSGYGAPWSMNGPFRLYETGGSGAGRPVYYADFMTIPGHSEFDGQFFNCVTEIRDDAGYEWYPSNDVAGSIGRGTRQTKRALDSMTLATLFTHGQYVYPISPDNWRAMLQGITDNLAGYDPMYVTLDHACQYVRAMHTSDITESTYDPDSRQVTTSLGGETDMPTMFHLFTEQGEDIHRVLVDVPTFSGSTVVAYTLAGPLDHIVVTPASATVATAGTQQFTAQGYDADDNPIPNLPFTWAVVSGGGTIDSDGLFTTGVTPGTYPDTVEASRDGIAGYATVEVTEPVIDHFEFEPISSPKFVDLPFSVTITARDPAGNVVLGYTGTADLSDSTGTVAPASVGPFEGGVWTGPVTIGAEATDVTLTVADGAVTGASNAFDVTTLGPGPHTIWGSTIPSSSYVGDTNAIELGVRLQAASDGYITGLRFWKDPGNSGAHIGHLWTADGTLLAEATFTGETASGWQEVTLPEPIPIEADTTYVASYHSATGYNAARYYFSGSGYANPPLRALADGEGGGNGVYCYDSDPCTYPVNTYQSSNYWVDVVFATDLEPPPPMCVDEPCTIWDDTFVPSQPSVDDPITRAEGVELGVKFRSSVAVYVTGVRFFKGSSETDDHPVHLWAADGTLLAEAAFTGPMTQGWQEVALSEPVPILANTTYIASYHTSTPWALSRPYFTSGYDNPPLRALADGEDGGNGVYAYGTPSLFPAGTYQSSNYWVDVILAGEPVNEPPVADTGGPYAYNDEGDAITLDASGSSDPDDNIVLYEWDLDDDGEYDDATGVATNVVFDDNGTFTVGLRVTDDYDESDTDAAEVMVDNVAPTATFNAPMDVDEGDDFELSLTGASDPSGADTTAGFDYTFDCGDGSGNGPWSIDNTAVCPTTDDDVRTVKGKIRDKDGGETEYTATVTVNNVPPTVDAGDDQHAYEGALVSLDPATFTDQGTLDTHTATIDWGDGLPKVDPATLSEADGSGTVSGNHSYADNGAYTVTVCVTDDDTATTCDTLVVNVENVAPTVTLTGPTTVDEGDTATYSYTVSDPGDDTFILDNETCGTGGTLSNSSFDSSTGAGSFDCTFPDGPATTTVSVTVSDDDGGSGSDSLTVNVNNVAPVVTVNIDSQTIQYSDNICEVTFTATDVAADTMTAATTPDPLPDGLVLTDNVCSVSGDTSTCTWTLAGTMDQPVGDYDITVTVTDDDGSGSADTTAAVEREDADIWLDDDNTVAVEVDSPGGDSPAFSLTAYVKETYPDDADCGADPGDINNAEVEMTLAAVGPGGSYTANCTPVGFTGTGYDAVLEVRCDFDDVEVNTYHVQATVVGDYYTSGIAEDALVVFDPSLGFTTGGGWFYWPGTDEKTNFGYTMKYNKKGQKVRGSLLLIRHMTDGSIYRVKSNALDGLALGESTDPPFGWASFSGKCTYKDKDWEEPEGNHGFLVYVEDYGEPGRGVDQFWIEVYDKDGNVIDVMSMDRPASAEAVEIEGGNIVVPHSGGGGR